MFLWMQEVPDVQREVLQEFVDAHVQNGATIERDGFKTYMGLKNGAINAKVYEVLSNLKTQLAETYHGRCENL